MEQTFRPPGAGEGHRCNDTGPTASGRAPRRYPGAVASVDPEEGTEQADAGGTGAAGRLREAGQSGPVTSGLISGPAEVDEPDGGVEEDEYLEDDDEVDEFVDELGRRHVRRAAPAGTDEMLENAAPRVTGLPDKVEKWRRNSATGAVITAFAFGLQQVFEPERKEPAIVMQTSGDPPKDLPVEAKLEQLGPRQSSVTVRRWLLGGEGQGKEPSSETSPEDEADGQ